MRDIEDTDDGFVVYSMEQLDKKTTPRWLQWLGSGCSVLSVLR